MKITSTKFPEGIECVIVPDVLEDSFMFIVEKNKQKFIGITQGFADYLKKEPNFEKAFIEYSEVLKGEGNGK